MEKTSSKKRILVLCGGKFALPALQKLAFEHFLCGVGIGKGQDSVVTAVENASRQSNLPFMYFPDKQSSEQLENWIKEIQPDYIFSISFPFRLSKNVLSYGEKKFINLHPGPLPSYRGPMPIFEVLRYQEERTAISAHYMNEEFDEGELIFNDYLTIQAGDTFGMLATRLSKKTAQVALNLANMLEFATIIPSEKQDENNARYFEFPEEYDSTINWKNMPSDMIVALINACNPWNGGASCMLNGEAVKLLSATVSDTPHQSTPGAIVSYTDEGKIKIACMDGKCILVDQLSCDWGILTSDKYVKFLES